jgi:hypothetical protein
VTRRHLHERSRALGLLLLLASAAAPARAQAPLGTEFVVNEATAGFQERPSVAVAADGRFIVVWSSPDASGWRDTKGRRFGVDGTPLGPEFLVNTYTPLNQGVIGSQAVDAAPDGRFVVAWSAAAGTGGPGVFVRRYDAGGNALGGEMKVSTTYGERACVAVADDGAFVVAWEHETTPPQTDEIRARKFDAAGNAVGSELFVNTISGSRQHWPSVAIGPQGEFVVVWATHHAGWPDVHGQRFDSAANALGGEFRVNTTTSGPQYFPSVAADADGSFVVAWGGEGPGDNWFGIFAQRFDPSGTPRGAELRLNRTTYGIQNPPTVTHGAGGDFFVAWAAGDGYSWGIFGQLMDREGRFLAPEFQVNTHTTSHQVNPSVSANAAGRLVVVWDSFYVDGDTTGIAGQRFGGLRPTALAVDAAGNGVAEPGEPASMAPRWLNTTGAAASVSGAASAFTGPAPGVYSVIDGTADYGTVANGSSSSCGDTGDCYTLLAAASPRPAAHWDARFTETLSSGHRWTRTLHVGESFADVPPTNPFYRFVETLLHRGVTSGCGGGAYCPGAETSREQMAAFVLVAREQGDYAPAACMTPLFADVPAASPFCRWIEELARRGVVAGCGGGNYCPGDSVTREQMAVFVLRTLDPALDPPACTTPVFADVPAGSPFCRWIEELFRRGVVTGCGGGSYCPAQPVTREQMSVFLGATFGLTLYGP